MLCKEPNDFLGFGLLGVHLVLINSLFEKKKYSGLHFCPIGDFFKNLFSSIWGKI